MIPLPRWAWPILLVSPCPVCGSATRLENVESVGIREKKPTLQKLEKGNFLLTFDYCCHQCKQKTLWFADPDDPNATAEDMAMTIVKALNFFSGKKPKSNRAKVSKSQISNKEFESVKKKLKTTESHQDFLTWIGIPIDQIEKLSKDKKPNGDQNK